MALKKLLGTRMDNQYFRPPPIKIKIIEIMDSPRVITWDFSQTNVRLAVTKNNKVAVITDGTTCKKITIFEQFGNKIKSGTSNFMRGHRLRGRQPPYFLNITGSTSFFQTSDMNITEDVCQEAEAQLHPRSHDTPLSECCTRQGLFTTEGQVVEVSKVIKVAKEKDFIPLKKITLQQVTVSAKVGSTNGGED
ncbi:V-type proton ATPase subunit E 1a isoform X3 [Sparus aurata]|uniref:V-type proton ATPase subunit E 1a isoform X3 n=1 Tax=Sparus aurata TaxID=8175 RepID=UPI0011C141B3|nr:uncharacterized protein LOC115587038 isoform X3 [Sparus aurata]